MTTTQEVAEWMASELKSKGRLDQAIAARHIRDVFGEEHWYTNDNGNLAISKKALRIFVKLTPEAVWNRWSFAWEVKKEGDMEKGRLRE